MSRGNIDGRPWSEEDNNLLITLYPETVTKNLAQRMGRTTRAVASRAMKLGLEKSYRHLQAMAGRNLKRGEA